VLLGEPELAILGLTEPLLERGQLRAACLEREPAPLAVGPDPGELLPHASQLVVGSGQLRAGVVQLALPLLAPGPLEAHRLLRGEHLGLLLSLLDPRSLRLRGTRGQPSLGLGGPVGGELQLRLQPANARRELVLHHRVKHGRSPHLGFGLRAGRLLAGELQRPLGRLEVVPCLGQLLPGAAEGALQPPRTLLPLAGAGGGLVEAAPGEGQRCRGQLDPGGIHRPQPLAAGEHDVVSRLACPASEPSTWSPSLRSKASW
jgi:hypothetical protein